MSTIFNAVKRSQYSVYGFCRRIGESFMIDEIVDICVGYYHIAESFDPEQNYHGMRIALDKDNKQFIEKEESNEDNWATVLGKTIIRKNEIFVWEFEVSEKPKLIDNTWKMVIGVVPSDYIKTSGGFYTFTPPNYGLIGSAPRLTAGPRRRKRIDQKFGEKRGDTLRMTLDLKQYSLSYVINGNEKVHCIEDLDNSNEYRLAISLCEGRKLKLVNAFCL